MSDVVVQAENLRKIFALGFFRKKVTAVEDVSFDVRKNEIFGFVGPNGAGKTTTIKMLMGLIFPTAGKTRLFGQPSSSIVAKRRLGFLPENPYFYDYLSGRELLDLMGRLFGLARSERRKRAGTLLDRVGLTHRARHRPSELSGGEMQRAAIARALINHPRILLADEPTGNLDSGNGQQIMALLRDLNQSEGLTIVMVTHNMELVADTDRVVKIADGRIETQNSACGFSMENN